MAYFQSRRGQSIPRTAPPSATKDAMANWQMNALGTEKLGDACVESGVERLVFASSCSLYDGLPPGMHHQSAPIQPRGAYATSKRCREERLLGLVEPGLSPVILRNGTVYGLSPRMRFDLVVSTFGKDAQLQERALLHGGGWMPGCSASTAAPRRAATS
jgi:nucleoside-diphosphate-sugar epimerase